MAHSSPDVELTTTFELEINPLRGFRKDEPLSISTPTSPERNPFMAATKAQPNETRNHPLHKGALSFLALVLLHVLLALSFKYAQ